MKSSWLALRGRRNIDFNNPVRMDYSSIGQPSMRTKSPTNAKSRFGKFSFLVFGRGMGFQLVQMQPGA
jgi:hypothetical protein